MRSLQTQSEWSSHSSLYPGDTTAYTTSWFMKEIHHEDNQHLDAANRIRAEAAELGFTNSYLGYGDTPVHQMTSGRQRSLKANSGYEEIAIHERHVGRDRSS